MNTCETFREQIDLRLDGMLEASLDARLSAHLAQCAVCRRYDTAQQALSGDLAMLSRAADVLAAPRAIQSRKTPNRLRVGRVAAAVAVAVLCTWTFVRRAPLAPRLAQSPIGTNLPREASNHSPAVFAFSIAPSESESRFAVPISVESPRMHMVWLYDTAPSVIESVPASAPSS